MQLQTTTKVNPKWSDYDKSVAKCHLADFGFILLDEYGIPRDDVIENSDIESNRIVRELTESDFSDVEKLDDESGFSLKDMLDCACYAWGIFENDILIGYCSLGGADVLDEDDDDSICSDPDYDVCASLLLSDVYVLPEYRHQNFATQMIQNVISKTDQTVYCCPLCLELESFYEKLGFHSLDESCEIMKRTKGDF